MEFSKKFFSIVEVSNYTRYAFTSNEDWVIPTDFGRERRFLMLDVSDAQVGNPEYFAAIQAELHGGGYEAFVYDMMRLEPPGGMSWESLRQAPQTDALNSQKLRGMTPGQEFFVDIVNSGTVPILEASANLLEPQPVRLSITERNRVYWPAIRQAYYDHVKNAGSHREARPSIFATYAAKILLAENDGKPMTARNALGAPGSAVAWGGSKQADHRGDAIVFPGLKDIVNTHHEAGRLRFDPRWGQYETVDEDD